MLLEENVPLNKSELEKMNIDIENKMDYEIDRRRLAYREPLTLEEISSDSESEKLFSLPSYNTLLQSLNMHKEKKTKKPIPEKIPKLKRNKSISKKVLSNR